jgi:hypothetical protein
MWAAADGALMFSWRLFRFLSPFPPADPRHYFSQRRKGVKKRIKKINRFWSGTGFGCGKKHNLSPSLSISAIAFGGCIGISDDAAVFGGVWCRIPCGVAARVAISGREGWHRNPEACTAIACLVKGVRGFVGAKGSFDPFRRVPPLERAA